MSLSKFVLQALDMWLKIAFSTSEPIKLKLLVSFSTQSVTIKLRKHKSTPAQQITRQKK